MDKFEQMMQKIEQMSSEESKEALDEKRKQCICPQCPTYNECAGNNDELLYCAQGKSHECITEEKECICPTCPVTSDMGLTKMFFCTKGTEKEQRE